MALRRLSLISVAIATTAVVAASPLHKSYQNLNSTTPTIQWQNCTDVGQPDLSCANLSVPLDWSNPEDGQRIRLGLSMQPARNQSEKIGSLLFNTGGPGDLATVELVGNGTGLVDLFISSQAEFDDAFDKYKKYHESCANMTGPLFGHVDASSIAHDLEAVRIALGNQPLNYLGLSYGTVYGKAYLEQFPLSVRTMALDGNVDHSASQPYDILTESRTYEKVLQKFFEWCDSDSECAISNGTIASAMLWDSLISRANDAPLEALGCQTNGSDCVKTVTGHDILINAQQQLVIKTAPADSTQLIPYTWPTLATNLYQAFYQSDGTPFASGLSPADNESSAYMFSAALCSDFDHSITTLEGMKYMQALLASTSPHTKGACEWFQVMVQCLGYPGRPKYPERLVSIPSTSAPILLINSYFDTESSYDWAVALKIEIANATLLTRNGVGHTSYLLKGEANSLIEDYLVNQAVPAPNTVVNT